MNTISKALILLFYLKIICNFLHSFVDLVLVVESTRKLLTKSFSFGEKLG